MPAKARAARKQAPRKSDVLRPVTVITGASAGIGAELARVFARNGHELVLIARRADKLAALAADLRTGAGRAPFVLPLDLEKPGAADRIGKALAARGCEPQFIVNNAGFGLIGRAADLKRGEQLAMIDVNVRALADLSLAFVPSLQRHRGGILNVASVVALLPGPGMAMYYATKHFVLALTESLHAELKPRGIRVTALCPGPVPTEFQARAGLSAGAIPGVLTVSAREVAEQGYRGLMAGKTRVMPGLLNRLLVQVPRLLPRNLMLRLVESRQNRRMMSSSGVS
jgi:short-subunit dehydrogenase